MSNEYELARDSRQDLIFTKEQLLAPLLPGMERPPHPMWLGSSDKDYYLGALANPGTSAGAEHATSSLDEEDGAAPSSAAASSTGAARDSADATATAEPAPAAGRPRSAGAHRRKP